MFANVNKWNHWKNDRTSDLILEFGYDKNITDYALAEALGVEGEYDESAMQLVFMNLPENKPSVTYAQTQLLENYIEKRPALQVTFDAWWEARYAKREVI